MPPNKGHLCYQMTYLLRQRRHGRRCARWGKIVTVPDGSGVWESPF